MIRYRRVGSDLDPLDLDARDLAGERHEPNAYGVCLAGEADMSTPSMAGTEERTVVDVSNREISEDFYLIRECELAGRPAAWAEDPPDWYQPGVDIHGHQSAFLFTDEETVLYDTLSPVSEDDIVQHLHELLDGRPLDYLVLSHTDTPHAANTFRIVDEFPDVELIAPAYGSTHEMYYLYDETLVADGDRLDIGTHTLGFHEAPFMDAGVSMFMSERETGALFTTDWFPFFHHDGECLAFVDEFDTEVTVERLAETHNKLFYWLEYVDTDRMIEVIETNWQKHRPELICPAHGSVIRSDTREYYEMLKEATVLASRFGRVGPTVLTDPIMTATQYPVED